MQQTGRWRFVTCSKGMAEPTDELLSNVFRDIVGFLEHAKMPYLIIGGIAQAVIGEPRLTQDVDCLVSVQSRGVKALLDGFQAAGFEVDRTAALERIETAGTFSVTRGRWRVDIILVSTDFEQSAFQRAQRLRLYDVEANFPTPEDLILLKLVPGREKDLLDVKTVMTRHRAGLERAYLERWAQRLSNEAEDPRMWQTLQRLLREADASS